MIHSPSISVNTPYIPKSGRHNHWGFNAEEQMTQTYLGMGEEDINVHDQWAVESMGAIQDRTREHLGTSDKIIMANRRVLLKAIETVQAGGMPPGIADPAIAAEANGPDTVDGVAPAGAWAGWWREQVQAKRAGAAWLAAAAAGAQEARAKAPASDEAGQSEQDGGVDGAGAESAERVIARLKQTVAELQAENAQLKARLAELGQ